MLCFPTCSSQRETARAVRYVAKTKYHVNTTSGGARGDWIRESDEKDHAQQTRKRGITLACCGRSTGQARGDFFLGHGSWWQARVIESRGSCQRSLMASNSTSCAYSMKTVRCDIDSASLYELSMN